MPLKRDLLLARGANNNKGTWFGLGTQTAYASHTGLRATKAHNRDAAIGFQYLRHPTVLGIFQLTSQLLEDSCLDFDRHYVWNRGVGELGRPARAAGMWDSNTSVHAGLFT